MMKHGYWPGLVVFEPEFWGPGCILLWRQKAHAHVGAVKGDLCGCCRFRTTDSDRGTSLNRARGIDRGAGRIL